MSGAPDLSAICQSCALCCDGTLFSAVPLTETEGRALAERGLDTRRAKSGAWSLLLGCGALRGGSCSGYEARPATCRAFKCRILRAVEQGMMDVSTARATIDRAKALRQESMGPELDAFLKRHFV